MRLNKRSAAFHIWVMLLAIACTSPSPTVEPVETELAVLQRTLQEVCADEHFFPKVDSQEAVYWLSCDPAAGHSTRARIERFAGRARGVSGAFVFQTESRIRRDQVLSETCFDADQHGS
jgi:hypothetical protein